MLGEILFYLGIVIIFVVTFAAVTWVLQAAASHEVFREQHIGGALVISLVTVGTAAYVRDLSLRPLFFQAVLVAAGWLAYRIKSRGREQYILWDGPDMKAHVSIAVGSFALTLLVGFFFASVAMPFSAGLVLAGLLVYAIAWLFMFPM